MSVDLLQTEPRPGEVVSMRLNAHPQEENLMRYVNELYTRVALSEQGYTKEDCVDLTALQERAWSILHQMDQAWRCRQGYAVPVRAEYPTDAEIADLLNS